MGSNATTLERGTKEQCNTKAGMPSLPTYCSPEYVAPEFGLEIDLGWKNNVAVLM